MNILTRYETVVAWVIRIGLFIIPFIPLYIESSLFFPYITGKAFVFRTIVQIVFALWVWLAIFFEKYRPQKRAIIIAVGIFMLMVTLATIFSEHPARSFWSNFERMEGLIAYLHLFAYFLVIAHVFNGRDWTVFFSLFLVGGLIENGYAFLQRLEYLPSIQGGFRVDGTIGNPTYLAAFFVFIIGFSTLLSLRTSARWLRYCSAAIVLLSLISIYFTATRGVTVALLTGAVLAAIVYIITHRATPLMRYIIYSSLAFIVIVPTAFWLLRGSSFVSHSQTLARLTSISFEDASARFAIWNMGWQGFLEHPLLGWGPELYPVIFAKYFDPSLYAQEPWFDRSHNIVLDWLINAGALGFLAYVGIFVAVGYTLWRLWTTVTVDRRVPLVIGAVLFVYVIQNLFVFDNIATYMSFFALLGYIVFLERESSMAYGHRSDIAVTDPVIPPLVLVLVLIPVVGTLYFFNFKPLRANATLMNALQYTANNNVHGAYDTLNRALAFGHLGRQEIREQLIRFGVAVAATSDAPQEFKLKVLQRVVVEAEAGINEHPQDPRMYLYLAAVLNRVGMADAALQVLEKARALAPKKQQVYFELADAYLQQQQYDRAAEVLKLALELDTRFDTARVNLAVAYILGGKQDDADRVLVERFGDHNPSYAVLATVYRDQGNYQRLAAVYRTFVKDNPQESKYRIELAHALVAAQQRSEAIAALTQAAKDIPSFTDQANAMIAKIKSGEKL